MSLQVSLNDVIEYKLETGDSVSRMYNILHYRVSGINSVGVGLPPAVAADYTQVMPAIIGAISAELVDEWAAVTSASYAFAAASAQCIYPSPRSRLYTTIFDPVRDGDAPLSALPAQDAITLLKRTPFGERREMGRLYVSGIPESRTLGSVVDEQFLNLYQALANAVASPVTAITNAYAITVQPVIYHRYPNSQQTRFTDITDAGPSDLVIKTMRRRRPGKGM